MVARTTPTMSMRFDRRISLQRKTQARDPDTGALVDAWETYAQPFCRREESFSNRAPDEDERAGVDSYQGLRTYWLHFRSDVKTEHRILDGDQIIQIVNLAEVERRRGLKIAAKEWTHE